MFTTHTLTAVGFVDIDRIHESAQSLVFRAREGESGRRVILKLLKEDVASPHQLVRYRREFEIMKALTFEGAIQAIDLRPLGRTLLIVQEDFGGHSLRDLLRERRLSLAEVLELSIQIVSQIERIHACRVIHKDINPSNIVCNPGQGILKIIDFGIATSLVRENPGFEHPHALVGTLAYISPEQTGRMNRAVDYRSDYYSLGATLYEMLTGEPPFTSGDVVELVHCHLARTPLPPHQRERSIPEAVSHVAMRLLEKTAEERYQSARGIQADLDACLQAFRRAGRIEPFPLGRADVSSSLQISRKLYGRAPQIEAVLASFKRSTQGERVLLLVAGGSGIGKTSVVHEVHRPITKQRGTFISGKYDQLQRAMPSSGIVAAFRSLVRQALSEEETSLSRWRARLLDALGPNGQVIIDVIPEVARIIGPQPAVRELGPAEAQARFSHVFRGFVRAFASKEHPLVAFLDDLQWADASSLKLIELLMTDTELSHFLLIGAYRDNEVSSVHPTMIMVEGLTKADVAIEKIHLGPLLDNDVAELCADTLRRSRAGVVDFASLVSKKTGGNPFFLLQFLNALHTTGLLAFDADAGCFTWDEAEISAQGFTENVVDLIGERLASFPERTQEALRTAALLGNRIDLSILAIALKVSEAEAFVALRPALDDEVILPLSAYRGSDSDRPASPLVIGEMRFAHDRVQQAAFQLFVGAARTAAHLKIGRLLREHLSPADRERRIFDIVSHLNIARALLEDPAEIWDLMRLNVEAGEKALASQAADAALECFTRALEDAEDIWRREPTLAFRATLGRAKAYALGGKPEEAEAQALELIERIDAFLGGDRRMKTNAYVLVIRCRTLMARYAACRDITAEGMRMFGIEIPTDNVGAAVGPLVGRIQTLLAGRPLSSLASLPEAHDPDARAMMEMLNELTAAAYFLDSMLFVFVGLELARLSLEHGLTGLSASALGMYGLVVMSAGDRSGGAEVGRAAIAIGERFGDSGQLSMACNLYGAHTGAWVEHVRALTPVLDRGCQAGLLGGVPATSAFNLNNKMMNNLFEGLPLEELIEKGWDYRKLSAAAGNTISYDVMSAVQLAMLGLAGQAGEPLLFSMEGENDAAWIEIWRRNNSNYAVCSFLVDRAMCHLLYGDPAEAACDLEASESLLPFVSGNLITAKHAFLFALTQARLLGQPPAAGTAHAEREAEMRKRREKLSTLHTMIKGWAELCPQSFRHMALFVDAEIQRIEGCTSAARDRYEEAVDDARSQGFMHHEAMAHERLATLYLDLGKLEYARLHLIHARRGYENWGAVHKVHDMDRHHGQLLGSSGEDRARGATIHPLLAASVAAPHTQGMTRSTTATNLDGLAVMRAAQSIAESIVLEELLGKLMQISLEIAGAQRGSLLLAKEDALVVVAEASAGSPPTFERKTIPLSAWDGGPRSLLSFVKRTLESVVVEEATRDARLSSDRYIGRTHARSLLAMPIVKQGRLIGALYLENNLARAAFTGDRVDVLHILAGQMATSLENARLYEELTLALVEAKQNEKLKGQFLANTSHELRTPLNAIINVPEGILARFSLLEIVHCESCGARFEKEGGENVDRDTACVSCGKRSLDVRATWVSTMDPGEMVPLLRAIESSGRYLLNVVDTILDFSRIEAGHERARLEDVDVRRIFRQVEESLKPLAAPKRVGLAFVLPVDEMPSIMADPVKVRQILNNLIGNAIKFSPEGKTVEVRGCIVNGDTCELSVRDEGVGIPKESQERIFESFRQLDAGDTRSRGGTGLGLAISRKLTEMHGGMITVESEPGKGSVFRVHLPLKGPRRSALGDVA